MADMSIQKITLVFCFLLWSCHRFQLSTCAEQPTKHAMKLLHDVLSGQITLPPIGQHTELSIGTYKLVKAKGLIETLEELRDANMFEDRMEIQAIIKGVSNMTPGGDAKRFTFKYSDSFTKLKFMSVAAVMVADSAGTGPIFNYTICSLNFKQPPVLVDEPVYALDIGRFQWWHMYSTEVERQKKISDQTAIFVETYFLNELHQRGQAKISNEIVELCPCSDK